MVGLHGTSKDIELDGEKTSLMQIELFISTFWGPAGYENCRSNLDCTKPQPGQEFWVI